jgi:hypothetical protein
VRAGVQYQIACDAPLSTYPGPIRVNLNFAPKALADSWPGSDSFPDRKKVKGSSAILVASAQGAGVESGEPEHNPGRQNGRTIWWSWAAPSDGRANIDGIGSMMSTIGIAAYTGDTLFGLEKVAEHWDATDKAKIDFPVRAGVTYEIVANVTENPKEPNVTLHLNFYKPGPRK